jgi:hypothetical protein
MPVPEDDDGVDEDGMPVPVVELPLPGVAARPAGSPVRQPAAAPVQQQQQQQQQAAPNGMQMPPMYMGGAQMQAAAAQMQGMSMYGPAPMYQPYGMPVAYPGLPMAGYGVPQMMAPAMRCVCLPSEHQ